MSNEVGRINNFRALPTKQTKPFHSVPTLSYKAHTIHCIEFTVFPDFLKPVRPQL